MFGLEKPMDRNTILPSLDFLPSLRIERHNAAPQPDSGLEVRGRRNVDATRIEAALLTLVIAGA